MWNKPKFLASTKQFWEHFCPFVRLSICQSVCLYVHLWHLFRNVHVIVSSWVITNYYKSDVHAKGQGQRSKVKVTEVKTQFSRFHTVIPVWIQIWQWNDTQSLMWYRRGALLVFNVIFKLTQDQKKSPILTWIERFWIVTPVWIHWWLWNKAQSLM